MEHRNAPIYSIGMAITSPQSQVEFGGIVLLIGSFWGIRAGVLKLRKRSMWETRKLILILQYTAEFIDISDFAAIPYFQERPENPPLICAERPKTSPAAAKV